MSFELGGPGGLLNKQGDKPAEQYRRLPKLRAERNSHKNASQVLRRSTPCQLTASLSSKKPFANRSVAKVCPSRVSAALSGTYCLAGGRGEQQNWQCTCCSCRGGGTAREMFPQRLRIAHEGSYTHTLGGTIGLCSCVRMGFENGSPLSVQSDDKTHAPLALGRNSRARRVTHMLEKGASINCRDKSGCTALLIATIRSPPTSVVPDAARRGCQPARQGRLRVALGGLQGTQSSLHFFRMGLSLKVQDNFGQAPIHLAALRGNAHAVDELLAQADERGETKKMLFLKDQDGKTPLTLAKGKKHLHLVSKIRTSESGWHWSRPMDIWLAADAKRAPYLRDFPDDPCCRRFPSVSAFFSSTTTHATLLSVGVVASFAMYITGYLCTFTDPGH